MESLCGDKFYLVISHVYSKFVPTNSCQFHVNSHQDTPLQLMKLLCISWPRNTVFR